MHHLQCVFRLGHDLPDVSVQGHRRALRLELLLVSRGDLRGSLANACQFFRRGVGPGARPASANAKSIGRTRIVMVETHGAQHEQYLARKGLGRTRSRSVISHPQSGESRARIDMVFSKRPGERGHVRLGSGLVATPAAGPSRESRQAVGLRAAGRAGPSGLEWCALPSPLGRARTAIRQAVRQGARTPRPTATAPPSSARFSPAGCRVASVPPRRARR